MKTKQNEISQRNKEHRDKICEERSLRDQEYDQQFGAIDRLTILDKNSSVNYIKLRDINGIIPNKTRSNNENKNTFIHVDWVVTYGEFLSKTKYNGLKWKVYDHSNGVNRGQACVFPEIAGMYLEWLCGTSGHELKARVSNLLYPTKKVYFLECNEFHKIGITENLKSRMSTIQNATPFKINLVIENDFCDAEKHESFLHLKYSQFKIQGEWFRLNKNHVNEIIAYIKKGDKLGLLSHTKAERIAKHSPKDYSVIPDNPTLEKSGQLALF